MNLIQSKIQQIWHSRYFISTAIKMDFSSRFSRSVFGSIWVILNPLVMVAIYAFVLSRIMQAKLPGIENSYAYPIYLIAGIIGWTLFTEVISRSLMVFIENGHYLKKLSFPRINLIFVVLGASLINSFILVLAATSIFALLDFPPTLMMLWLVPLLLVTALFALGIGISCGILNVFLRDIGQIVPIILQLLFWVTPIVYTINIIPPEQLYILEFNPVLDLISMYHDVLAYQRAPSLESFKKLIVLALIANIIAMLLYKKAHKEIVEEL